MLLDHRRLSPEWMHPEVATDLPGQIVAYLDMPRNGRSLVEDRVVPPRVPAAFPQEMTTVRAEMCNQLVPFHTAIVSSEKLSLIHISEPTRPY